MPGSESSCSSVAVLRSTGPVRRGVPLAPVAQPPWTTEERRPTHSCSPSTSTRARFRVRVDVAGARATCRPQRVDHAGPGRQLHDAGSSHPAFHVDHHEHGGGRRGGSDRRSGRSVRRCERGDHRRVGSWRVTSIASPRGRPIAHQPAARASATPSSSSTPRPLDVGHQRIGSTGAVGGSVSGSGWSNTGTAATGAGGRSGASSCERRRRARSARRLRLLGTAAR